MREKQISTHVDEIKIKSKNITEDFIDFSDGMRMLLLLQRKKDGGNNQEEKRVFETYITLNSKEFQEKLFNLLILQSIYPDTRIYLSCNARNQKKVIREIYNSIVEQYYSDEECSNSIQKKIIKNPRHFVMQPSTRETSYFIIDVDDIDGRDVMGETLTEISRLNVTELKRYRTKNGWHIIVEPFNIGLWNVDGVEVKKDPLILLNY
jgi:hypothetical protein